MSFTACSEHVLWQHVATLSQPPSVTLSLTKFLAICSHFLLHNSLMEPTAHTLQKKIPTSAYTLEKAMAPHSSTLAWQAAVHGVAKSQTRLSNFTFTFHFHALEKEMAIHSGVLAWRIPGRGSLVGCRLWDRSELDTTKVTQQQQQQTHIEHSVQQKNTHSSQLYMDILRDRPCRSQNKSQQI